MSKSGPEQHLRFYPAYCYPASSTYFIWVKLTCYDIHHHLKTRAENHQHQSSTGNPLYFYLNHPIQFVQLTGIVVAVEDFHPHIFLFTLDDSSGSTIDVVGRKPKPQLQDDTIAPLTNTDTSAKVTAQTKPEDDLSSLLPLLTTLTIGSTVLAKGTLSRFRSSLQLNLLRLTPITPIQELRLISSRTTFLLSTLGKPWSLSPSTQSKLLNKATGERDEENDRAVRARKVRESRERREKRHTERISREWEEEQKARAREAETARQDGVEVMRMIQNRKAGRQ